VNINEYILSLTSGFLSAPEEKIKTALEITGGQIELHEPGRPGSVSLAGINDGGDRSGFSDWLNFLRKEGIREIKVLFLDKQKIASLPSPIAAVFAASEDFVLTVVTEKKHRSYNLRSIYSSGFQISPAQFMELVDYQEKHVNLWNRITELVEEFVQMNSIQGFDTKNIHSFLQEAEGIQVFEFLAPQLLQEMQVECYIHKIPFKIPAHLEELLFKSEPESEEPGNDSVYFYATKDITAGELLSMVSSQPDEHKIWKACEKEFRENPHEEIPALKASEWIGLIKRINPDLLQELCSTICRIIAEICEKKGSKPVIPKELQYCFGPDEIEEKRAQARSRMVDHWFLQSNSEPWELHYFELLPQEIKPDLAGDIRTLKAQFSKSLKDAADFAKKINSPFKEAFSLGSYFLQAKVPERDFNEDDMKLISKDLQKKGFSEIAIENSAEIMSIGKNTRILNFENWKIYSLFALSISDVFGGMGSWNDIHPESPEEYEAYERISSELFLSRKNYLAALLSS
jgi:hypothetical protein